jgi:hypothetical protein
MEKPIRANFQCCVGGPVKAGPQDFPITTNHKNIMPNTTYTAYYITNKSAKVFKSFKVFGLNRLDAYINAQEALESMGVKRYHNLLIEHG